MTEVLTRAYALLRDAAADSTDGDGRTLTIRAVPFDVEAPIAVDTLEVFDRVAFDAQLRAANRVSLTLGHPREHHLITESLLARLSWMEAREDGLYVQARMASTSVANDALALINDGVLDEASVGFVDLRTTRSRRDGVVVLRRMAARLDHLALVPAGAYGQDAKVLAVRSQMTEGPTLDDLRQLAAGLS